MIAKERFALSVSTSDLGWSDLAIKPVELIAGLSAASNLGSDIHRAKSMDQTALRRAVRALATKGIRIGHKKRLAVSSDMAQLMAVTALFERCHPYCRSCNGAKVLISGELKIVCDTCSGVGIHRYTDRERSKLCWIQPSEWPKFERRYQMFVAITLSHDIAPILANLRMGY